MKKKVIQSVTIAAAAATLIGISPEMSAVVKADSAEDSKESKAEDSKETAVSLEEAYNNYIDAQPVYADALDQADYAKEQNETATKALTDQTASLDTAKKSYDETNKKAADELNEIKSGLEKQKTDSETAVYNAKKACENANASLTNIRKQSEDAKAAETSASTALTQSKTDLDAKAEAYNEANEAAKKAYDAADAAKKSYDEAKADLDQTTANYKDIDNALSKAEATKEEAKKALSNAKAAYDKASEDAKTAEENYKTESAKEDPAIIKAADEVKEKQATYDAAEKAYNEEKEKYDAAAKAVDEAKKALNASANAALNAKKDLDKANEAVNAAKKAYDDATAAYKNANDAYSKAVADATKNHTLSEAEETKLGQELLQELTGTTYDQWLNAMESSTDLKPLMTGNFYKKIDNALKISNLRTAAEGIADVTTYRKNETQRPVPSYMQILKVSPLKMWNTAFSNAFFEETNEAHFYSNHEPNNRPKDPSDYSENWAGDFSMKSANKAWYDEITIYQNALNDKTTYPDLNNDMTGYAIYEKYPALFHNTGHYLNMVDSEYTSAGMSAMDNHSAGTQRYWNGYVLQLGGADGTEMDVDSFISKIDGKIAEYKANHTTDVSSDSSVIAAKTAMDSADADVKKKEDALKAANTALKEAETKKANADADVKANTSDLSDKGTAKSKAKAALDNAASKKDAAGKDLNDAKSALTQKQEEKDKALKALKEKVDAAKADEDAKSKVFKDAETTLNSSEKKLEDLNALKKDGPAILKKKEDDTASLKVASDKASAFLTAANEKATAEKNAYDKAASDFKAKEEDYNEKKATADSAATELTKVENEVTNLTRTLETAKNTLAEVEKNIKEVSAASPENPTDNKLLDSYKKYVSAAKELKSNIDKGEARLTELKKDAELAKKTLEDASAALETATKEYAEAFAVYYPLAPDYKITTVEPSYTDGSSEGLTIKSDGDFDQFQALYIDNKLVDKSNYTVKKGSTIVTLKDSFLNTLSAGDHIVEFEYKYGTKNPVKTTFHILPKKAAAGTSVKAETLPKATEAKGKSPKTGFGYTLPGEASLLFGLAGAVSSMFLGIRRKKRS